MQVGCTKKVGRVFTPTLGHFFLFRRQIVKYMELMMALVQINFANNEIISVRQFLMDANVAVYGSGYV